MYTHTHEVQLKLSATWAPQKHCVLAWGIVAESSADASTFQWRLL